MERAIVRGEFDGNQPYQWKDSETRTKTTSGRGGTSQGILRPQTDSLTADGVLSSDDGHDIAAVNSAVGPKSTPACLPSSTPGPCYHRRRTCKSTAQSKRERPTSWRWRCRRPAQRETDHRCRRDSAIERLAPPFGTEARWRDPGREAGVIRHVLALQTRCGRGG